MPGRRGARAREQGLERTDNQMEFSSWPQVGMINQKNYYTEYLKRDDQILVLRQQNEENRNRMAKEARDKDRTFAHSGQIDLPPNDLDMAGDETGLGDEAATSSADADSQGSKIIVIHPGSQNLRIGLSNDALPRTVPMVVAHKVRTSPSDASNPPVRPFRTLEDNTNASEASKMFGEEFSKRFTELSADVKMRMRKKGRRIVPNCKEVAISFNRKTPPDMVSEHNDFSRVDWTEVDAHSPESFTGHEALRIPDTSSPPYKLYWPLRYGFFNEADYLTKDQVLRDFALVLEDAIKKHLGLSQKKDWHQYSCVYVIPDLYERNYVTTVLDLLLREFGFGRVCFIQESLSGSFGAGYPTCCIVDIGAQKTSICCVDEGMCIENSRINLRYGGEDVTDTFIKLMLCDCFPYSEIDLNRRHDFLLAEELKQKFCTLSVQDFTAQQYEFFLRLFNEDTRHYFFKAYDEVILAPMCLFRTELLDLSHKLDGRRNLVSRSYDLYDGSPNDPLSAAQTQILTSTPDYSEQLEGKRGTESSKQNELVNRVQGSKLYHQVNGTEGIEDQAEARSSLQALGKQEDPSQGARSSTPGGGDKDGSGPTPHPLIEMVHSAKVRDRTISRIPLNQAIRLSIEQGARGDDRKMRDFFGGIIAVGGGVQTNMFKEFLEEELADPQSRFRKDIMVAPPPREMDPQVLVWKGASVFGKLQGTNDSWIGSLEYDRLGSRLLAYKCLWSW